MQRFRFLGAATLFLAAVVSIIGCSDSPVTRKDDKDKEVQTKSPTGAAPKNDPEAGKAQHK